MAKIDPRIKAAADPIYLSDPVKYARLIVWIKQCEKYNYSTEAIVNALETFRPKLAVIGAVWWPYLDVLVTKQDRKLNARSYEVAHRRRKDEERQLSKRLFE